MDQIQVRLRITAFEENPLFSGPSLMKAPMSHIIMDLGRFALKCCG